MDKKIGITDGVKIGFGMFIVLPFVIIGCLAFIMVVGALLIGALN